MSLSGEPAYDDRQLERYLLGLLPEEEAERLDELSIADDEIVGRLRAVENDLVDAYVNGSLQGETRARFETVYLASPKRRERVEVARTFRQAIRRADATALETNAELDCLRAAAAARGTAADSPSVPASAALVLRPQKRGAESVPTLTVPGGVPQVTLALRLDTNDFPRYQVALNDPAASHVLWRSASLAATSTDGHATVVVTIPAGLLKSRHYILELSGQRAAASEVVASYALEIIRHSPDATAGCT